jgi:hypothetical protein
MDLSIANLLTRNDERASEIMILSINLINYFVEKRTSALRAKVGRCKLPIETGFRQRNASAGTSRFRCSEADKSQLMVGKNKRI